MIARGYSGKDLLKHFKKAQGQVRPAVEAMLADAEQAASSESGHISYEDVFGMEDKVMVVIMAGTRENFYDQLKHYISEYSLRAQRTQSKNLEVSLLEMENGFMMNELFRKMDGHILEAYTLKGVYDN